MGYLFCESIYLVAAGISTSPVIVAIVVYMLLHLAINGLLRIIAHRKVEV